MIRTIDGSMIFILVGLALLLVATAAAGGVSAFKLQSVHANDGVSLVPVNTEATLHIFSSNSSATSSFAGSTMLDVTLVCNSSIVYTCSPVVRLSDTEASCTMPPLPPVDCVVDVMDQSAIKARAVNLVRIGNRLTVSELLLNSVMSNVSSRPIITVSLLHPMTDDQGDGLFLMLAALTSDIAVCNGSVFTKLVSSTTLSIQTHVRTLSTTVSYSKIELEVAATEASVWLQFPTSDMKLRTISFIVRKSMVRSPADSIFVVAPRTPMMFTVVARELANYDPTRLILLCSYTSGGPSAFSPLVFTKFINPALVMGPYAIPGRSVDEGKWVYCRWQLSAGIASEFVLPPPMNIYYRSSNTNVTVSGSCVGGLTLSDASTNNTAYSFNVPPNLSSCVLDATAAFSGAQVSYDRFDVGTATTEIGSFNSNRVSVLAPIEVGTNIMWLRIRSEAGNIRIIQLNITRSDSDEPSSSSSTNTTIQTTAPPKQSSTAETTATTEELGTSSSASNGVSNPMCAVTIIVCVVKVILDLMK